MSTTIVWDETYGVLRVSGTYPRKASDLKDSVPDGGRKERRDAPAPPRVAYPPAEGPIYLSKAKRKVRNPIPFAQRQAAAISFRDAIVANMKAMPAPEYPCVGGCGMLMGKEGQRCGFCKIRRHTELARAGKIAL